MKFGEYIREYRLKNKITMQQFADASGLSKGYVSVLEKGKRPNSTQPIVPSIETYSKVAIAMQLSLNELLESIDSDCLIDITNTPEAQEYKSNVDSLVSELSISERLQTVLNDDEFIGDYKFTDDQLREILEFARFKKAGVR